MKKAHELHVTNFNVWNTELIMELVEGLSLLDYDYPPTSTSISEDGWFDLEKDEKEITPEHKDLVPKMSPTKAPPLFDVLELPPPSPITLATLEAPHIALEMPQLTLLGMMSAESAEKRKAGRPLKVKTVDQVKERYRGSLHWALEEDKAQQEETVILPTRLRTKNKQEKEAKEPEQEQETKKEKKAIIRRRPKFKLEKHRKTIERNRGYSRKYRERQKFKDVSTNAEIHRLVETVRTLQKENKRLLHRLKCCEDENPAAKKKRRVEL